MAAELEPGTSFGPYRIERVLGRGGMGVVYLAEQRSLGRRVALKLIAPALTEDWTFRARFERELRTAALIEHPNVIPVYEAGEEGDTLFIAMRYVDGHDLRELLAFEGSMPSARATAMIAQVAAALDAAHARGLVHRDVKPANVLVAGSPPDEHAYLTDFGLTKQAGGTGGLTASGEWLGTVDYVAPEQVSGRSVDARADVYSLGCVLYAALTGEVPYPRDTDVAKLYAHVHEPPPSLRERNRVPPALADAVTRALAKEPTARFPSAGDFARAAAAGAHESRVTVPERSVAVGEAAAKPVGSTIRDLPPPPPRPSSTAVDYQAPHAERPTASLPRRGGRGLATAIVLAALVLALGGVAAALIATGTFERTARDKGTKTGATGKGGTNGQPTTKVAGVSLVPFSAGTYDARRPAGWVQTKSDEQNRSTATNGYRYVSKWQNGVASVLIDTTLNTSGDPAQSARKLDAGHRANPTYRPIALEPSTVNRGPAFTWEYDESGTRYIDIFFFAGRNGYAVLGAAPPADFERVRGLAVAMADSVRPK